ncbi:TetR/AcrR family transcriptional regulator [Agromyces sp. H3Y2-19a]|uniref:TetR/AcrR family transcriptional regulator n=1 Tax=Agromyces chromiiresistens TaxID=3030835 RepID=UPI0023B93740|nr:TetR/AcrR family transcriptional regulator [Agromyces chromiiresistens]MDF0512674.1 TetR/AcrR family transcriptional regulator [Agromyces chromiiresistens]
MATKAEQRDRTRSEIVRLATARFAVDGYAGVALEDLMAEAGLTRGALYHHFGSKRGLFQAVVEHAQLGVARAVEQAATGHDDVLDDFLAGCRAFLEASLAPEVRRILLIEGPAVLGWGEWREGDLESSVRLLDEGVAELAEAGVIDDRSLDTVATMLSGALNEVAIANAAAPDPARGIDDAVAMLRRFVLSLRPADAT